MRELEAALQAMPASFRSALEPYQTKQVGQAIKSAQSSGKARAAMEALESVPAGEGTREQVEAQLAKLTAAQASLAKMSADPSTLADGMPAWLRSVGIDPDEVMRTALLSAPVLLSATPYSSTPCSPLRPAPPCSALLRYVLLSAPALPHILGCVHTHACVQPLLAYTTRVSLSTGGGG